MSHYCPRITATRQIELDQCRVCDGSADEGEVARVYREVRKPSGVGIREFWTGVPGMGTFHKPIEGRHYKGRTVRRVKGGL